MGSSRLLAGSVNRAPGEASGARRSHTSRASEDALPPKRAAAASPTPRHLPPRPAICRSVCCCRLTQSGIACADDGVRSIGNLQLAKYGGDIISDGARAEDEPVGNLTIGGALRHQLQDLA